MKKTVNVSLGGLSFAIEEDAYARLDAYLSDVRKHFAHYSEADEIVRDIESRFAEKFSEKPKDVVITLADVDSIISAMGSPEQFEDQDAKASGSNGSHSSGSSATKRMYRDPDDVLIAGVASGVAAYFGIKPIWIRILFLVLVSGGFGIVLYLVLWAVVPQAKTETEKMQMRGESVNLKNLEQIIKDRADEFKNRNKGGADKTANAAGGFLAGIFRIIGKIIRIFVMVIVKFIGGIFVFASAVAIVAVVFSFGTLIFNGSSRYVDFPFQSIAHGWVYYTALVSGVFVVLIPLIFLILFGVSMVSSRWSFKKASSISMTGIWIAALIVLGNTAIRLEPQIRDIVQNSPQFKKESREVDAKDFTKVQFNGGSEATIYPSNTFKVIVTGRERDLDNVTVLVKDGTLMTQTKDGIPDFCLICIHGSLKYEVYMPVVDAVKATGASSVTLEQRTAHTPTLKLSMSGASHILLTADTDSISADLSGASHLDLLGKAPTVTIDESGASHIDASQILIQNVTAHLSGASRLELGDVQSLTTNLSGASKVIYVSVQHLDNHASGASRTSPAPDLPEDINN